MAGLWLGNTASNRSPKTRRLKPVGGEITAAPSSRQNPGVPSSPSSNRLAIRKSGSPKKAAADSGRDLVVDGGGTGLAPQLPEKAADEGIPERFPEVEAGRSRESIVDGSRYGMQELVHGEGVCVDDPLGVQVMTERSVGDVVHPLINIIVVDSIQQSFKPEDIDGREDVAPVLLCHRLPVLDHLRRRNDGRHGRDRRLARRRDIGHLQRVRSNEVMLLGEARARRQEDECEGPGEERPSEIAGRPERAHDPPLSAQALRNCMHHSPLFQAISHFPSPASRLFFYCDLSIMSSWCPLGLIHFIIAPHFMTDGQAPQQGHVQIFFGYA